MYTHPLRKYSENTFKIVSIFYYITSNIMASTLPLIAIPNPNNHFESTDILKYLSLIIYAVT